MRLGGGGRCEARPNVTSFSHERAFSRSCEIIGRMRRRRLLPSSSSRLPFLRYADYSGNAALPRIPMRSCALDSLHSRLCIRSIWLTCDLSAFCFILRVKKVNGAAEKRSLRDTERARANEI